MNKLNVAYFAFSEEYGGNHAGFTHSFYIIKALSNLDVKIKAFFKFESNLGYNGLDVNAVIFPSLKNLFKVNPFEYIGSYFSVRKKIRNVEIIHERFHVNPIDLFFIGKKPYILEVNDPAIVLHDSFLYKYLINLKFRRCNCIITQTETLKKILSKYTNKQIYVVSNGVDTSVFGSNIKSNIRKIYNIKNNEILVIYVGAFMQWHGVNDFVSLANKFKNVKFLMIGDGPEFENVKKSSYGMSNLILLGSKHPEEIPKYLYAADICIAPFNTEKFKKLDKYGFWWCPVKLFEYMATGKPVLSYNYEEVKNIIKDGGLLAQPGNFKDFTKKLDTLINNLKLRSKLGNKARKIALNYDWSYRAKEIYEIYKKCLKN